MYRQRGFALLELVVAALIATLLAVWGAGMLANRFNDARAQAMAVWMLSVRGAVQSYMERYGNSIAIAQQADALSSNGYDDWQRPTLPELKADGLLASGFPEYGAGHLQVGIQLLPGERCPGEGCRIQALVYSVGAVVHKRSGLVDQQMIAQWLLATQGMGARVDARQPAWVRGPAVGFPNPPHESMPALPAGTIAMAVTTGQLAGSLFLRVGDDRNPDFQGSASVRGDIRTKKSLAADDYLFLGREHDAMSLCGQDGAIAREARRGLLVCQEGVWRSAGAGGGRLFHQQRVRLSCSQWQFHGKPRHRPLQLPCRLCRGHDFR